MFTDNQWPPDYFSSREKFITGGRSSAAQMSSMNCEALGPDGESLSVDIAACISDTDQHRLVITCGLHGAEGFIGAAIQRQVLRIIANEGLPNGVGVVLIHAVNPWGYAHLRRVDEHNVDVNRNFIAFGHEPADKPTAYSALDPIINPQSAPSLSGDVRYWLSAGGLIVKNKGIEPLVGPIAEGQYDFPKGLFFGGNRISESRRRLETIVGDFTAHTPQVTVLDVHSGLGPAGVATLISNSNQIATDKRIDWLQQHYQMPVVLDSSPSNAYDASGSWSQQCQRTFPDQRFTFLCVEIGTVNPIKLFNALRRENQAHHWAPPKSAVYGQTKKALANVFAPDSNRWREKAVEQGVSVFQRSLVPPIAPIK